MSSPADIPLEVMAQLAKDLIGPLVIGTFLNICLVSVPVAQTAYG